jgi:hypothetical protein
MQAPPTEPVEAPIPGLSEATKSETPPNPCDADPSEEPVDEVWISSTDPRVAAWTSFCQALIASVEFRYLQ